MDALHLILIVLAALILLYILWCLAEPFFLDFDKARLRISSVSAPSDGKITVKNLPMVTAGANERPDFNFFFFSDIHAEWCPVTSKKICSCIRNAHELNPLDAVIFGGDLITYPRNAAKGYKYLNTISECCKELGIPFYGITGNHDVKLTDAPALSGYKTIDNISLPLISRTTGKKAYLAGIKDTGTRKCEWHDMPATNGNDPVILVAHDPDTLINLKPDTRPEFMLAGHLHGGQMKFPFRVEFRILRKKDRLPNMGAVQGVYEINNTSVFISRGLGCGLLPFRFLSVPEATVVEICL